MGPILCSRPQVMCNVLYVVLLMLSGNCGYSVQQNLGWDKIIEANTRTVT